MRQEISGLGLFKEFRQMDELSPLAIEGLALEMIVERARRNVRPSYHTPHSGSNKQRRFSILASRRT
jgi:hypothetical protein